MPTFSTFSLTNPYHRLDAFPVDDTSIFTTLTGITAYAADPYTTAYPGQIVVATDTYTTYIITSTGNQFKTNTLVKIGADVDLGQVPFLSANWNTAYVISTAYSSVSSTFATNTTVNTLTGLLVKTTDLNTLSATLLTRTDANTLTSQLVKNTTINYLTGNWNSAYTYVSLMSTSLNSAVLELTSKSLTADYVYGTSDETVFTDGSNLAGNGPSTLTLNYTNGVYTSSPIKYNNVTSDQWNAAVSTASALSLSSGNWNLAYSIVSGGIVTTINLPQSANWNTAYVIATGLQSLSGNWQSTYATVCSLSSNWNTSYILAAGLQSLSSNWQSTYATVCALSSNWNTSYILATELQTLSANWQSTYATVCSLSSNWNTAYILTTSLQTLSSNWQSTYATVCALSANWQSTYATVCALSANWNTSYVIATGLRSLSGNWQNAYSFISSATATTLNLNNLNVSGTLSATTLSLSSNFIYGVTNESVFTDGSNLVGNGTNTLTMNYTNGVYINSNVYLSSTNIPSAIFLYDPSGNRWRLTVTTSGTLSTVRA